MALILLMLNFLISVCVAYRPIPQLSSGCHVGHASNDHCGQNTPTYCESCPEYRQCPENPVEETTLSLFDMTDGTPESEVYFTEEEYFLFKQLTLDYTIEFLKSPLQGDKSVSLPYCGLRKPINGRSKKEKRSWLSEAYKKGERWVQTHDPFDDRPKKPTPKALCLPTELHISVHFSIFTAEYSTSQLVTVEALQKQIDKMNEAYIDLKISFDMASVHYHIGEQFRKFTQNRKPTGKRDSYFTYSESVKAQHHYGGTDDVNVYIVESINDLKCKGKGFIQTAGYCYPAQHLNVPSHAVDGCVIILDDLPGVTYRAPKKGSGKGNTLVHELGHWFGLDHTFSTEPKCLGTSDTAEDTIRFPMDPKYIHESYQPTCCLTGKEWDFCPGENGAGKNIIHNSNWMSYSPDMGDGASDEPGARPWTNDQRREIFVNYYTFRKRKAFIDPKHTGKCFDGPVYDDLSPDFQTRGIHSRSNSLNKVVRHIRSTSDILRRGAATVKTLKKICQYPRVPGVLIDSVTGETIFCDDEGRCQPPTDGWLCLDGTQPPCKDYIPGTTPSPHPVCIDGSAPPCSGPLQVCPAGQALTCALPEGETISVTPPGPEDSPVSHPDNTTICGKACNVHLNTCDAETAPTCTFPDPRVRTPRSACACRAGYKAGLHANTDTAKQWRLPVLGQEYRVWVAEGVKCETLCAVSHGVNSCQEVTLVDKVCIG